MRLNQVVKANQEFVPPYGTGATLYLRPLLIGVGDKELIANRSSKTLADGCDVALAGELTYETLCSSTDETVLVEEKRYRNWASIIFWL